MFSPWIYSHFCTWLLITVWQVKCCIVGAFFVGPLQVLKVHVVDYQVAERKGSFFLGQPLDVQNLGESVPFDITLSAKFNSLVLVEEVSSFNFKPVCRANGVSIDADPRISNSIYMFATTNISDMCCTSCTFSWNLHPCQLPEQDTSVWRVCVDVVHRLALGYVLLNLGRGHWLK